MSKLYTAKKPQFQPRVTPKNDTVFWDQDVKELGVRRRGNSVTWIVQTRVDGRTKRRTLGSASAILVEQARVLALEVLGELHFKSVRSNPSMQVKEFARIFLADCENRWKPNTFKTNSGAVRNRIIPALGDTAVSDIEHHDVVQWYSNMDAKEGYRNRILAVLSEMMKHAEVFGLREAGSNPCRGLRKHKTEFDGQYLDAKGYAKLGQALRRHEEHFPLQVSFIWFLALTGCRKGEAESTQWGQLERNYIALPDSKTGPKAIWLGSQVRKLLRELPKTQAHIFAPSDDKEFQKHLVKVWDDVRTHMKRPKFRLHDLRHSFASTAINAGFDLRVIGGLLGHSDPDTTAGYAHLNKKNVEEASDRVGKHFEKTLGTKKELLEPTTGLKAARKQSRFVRFTQSKLNVPDFCKSEGLDQKTFRRELLKWRELNQKGVRK